MKKSSFLKSKGSILILALWALSFLSIFALYLGMTVRQKIILLKRLESRDQLELTAQAGIKKAATILNEEIKQNNELLTMESKMARHNNPEELSRIVLGQSVCDVSYEIPNAGSSGAQEYFGIVDEESKVNINKIGILPLRNLIKDILHCDDETAQKLATAIIDWREYGESEIVGFYSDEYYDNLQYPYPAKNADFEVIDELLLVKGMNKDILKKLSLYVTVYGDGKVNLNTASAVVLAAAGLRRELIDKILSVRRGIDMVDASRDDYVFQRSYDLANYLGQFMTLEAEEIAEINQLNGEGKLGTNSFFYSIESHAKIPDNKTHLTIKCVFDANEKKFVYWKESP